LRSDRGKHADLSQFGGSPEIAPAKSVANIIQFACVIHAQVWRPAFVGLDKLHFDVGHILILVYEFLGTLGLHLALLKKSPVHRVPVFESRTSLRVPQSVSVTCSYFNRTVFQPVWQVTELQSHAGPGALEDDRVAAARRRCPVFGETAMELNKQSLSRS